MIHIDALCGLGDVRAPIPDGFSLLNAESWLRRRFEGARAIITVLPGLYGTGELDFDLDIPTSMPTDYQAPRYQPSYQVALRLGAIEIDTKTYFEAVRAMKVISSANPIEIRSASGGNGIFIFTPSIISGVRL